MVPVALYHADLPGFEGGFAGVDVFFVISGYLITGVLLSGSEEGVRGLGTFYERRARRILPALFPLLAVAWVAGWAIHIPEDFRRLSQAIMASAGFVSNLLFALRNRYFATDAGFAPLVHLWSLAVEEQFYLFYPIVVIAIRRWRPRLLAPALGMGAAISFALMLTIWPSHQDLAYSLGPTRAWELLAGALVAVLPASSARTGYIGGSAGLALIGAGYALLALTEWPIPLVLMLPVAGTSLVLRDATAVTPVGRLLGWRPLVAVGLVSYGFYLWHQVLLAYLDYLYFDQASYAARVAAVITALPIAWASLRWIEAPVRQRRVLARRRTLVAACAGGLAVAGLVGLAGHLRWIEPHSAIEQRALGGTFAGPAYETYVPPGSARLPFLLYGDSHARQYLPAMRVRFGDGALLARSACMDLPDAVNYASDRHDGDECRGQFAEAKALLANRPARAFVWAQRWERALYAEPGGAALGSTTAKGPELLLRELERVRAQLPPGTRLILIGNEPTAAASAPQMSDGWLRCDIYRNVSCPRAYPASLAEGRAANAVLRAFAAGHTDVDYIDAAGALCSSRTCPIFVDGKLVYSDGTHLTDPAAKRVVAQVPDFD